MPNKFESIIGLLGEVIELIAEQMGKSTSEVLNEISEDCAARAKDPSDDSDKARREIEEDLSPEP